MSVYVTGGGGTHLEPRVTSHYLAAMIAEGGARGVLGRVTGVKTQQSEIDAPLDDLVIDGRLPDGTATRLDLQITTTLSFTESDEKWQDVVPRAWDTFRRPGFNGDTDRIGIAVSQTTTKLERSVQPLLARARHAADAGQYRKRLVARNGSSKEQRDFQALLDKLVQAHDRTATDDEIVTFLKSVTIIAFDLDQEDASRDRLASIDQLAPVVGGTAEARQVWSSLTAMASRVIPAGGGVDRATVARELQAENHTIGSDRAHAELIAALDGESRLAAASIRDTIGGKAINRDAVLEAVLDARVEFRMLRIVGQHGTGKSAILKRLALDEPAGAPILLLRDIRVTGGGWTAHAARFGRQMPLASLLREFGLGGSRTLFIDGADKMDATIQVTVNDVLKVIGDTPDLDDWRVVMTMREENAQRVDGWLDPDATANLTSKTIRVDGFDDDEAAEAGEASPLLRALLSDPRNYDTVLRRPFFLDALSRLPLPAEGEVRSEVDLVELWWQHGGADGAEFAPAQGRRNTLLALGEQLLARPGAPLAISELEPVPLQELLDAGVLRHIEHGITVAFSHDIYEEWILERILRKRRGEIANALRDGRQDLQLARPLQLLATHLLERSENGDDWAALLGAVEADGLRATWSRVVLTAPVRSVRSEAMLERIKTALLCDGARLLGRLILSVRTTETVRDLRFLDEKLIPDLSSDKREQYASEAAVPELVTWMRLLAWLVPRLADLPQTLHGEIYDLLDAWVRAVPSDLAKYLLVPGIAEWARAQLGDSDSSKERPSFAYRTGPRANFDRARALLLGSASGAPEIVRDYLATVSDRALRHTRKQFSEASGGLATALPAETSDFLIRAYVRDHDRNREHSYSGMRDRADVLGFDDLHDFYPASPARPPFLMLLRSHPEIGLELVRIMCNHAMEGWRRSWRRTGGSPIPIGIDLGERDWEFWGDDQTYGWFRGGSHVHILDTALLALDAWAHERLKAGEPLDDLCRRVARGNDCNAVLGICAGLCMVDLGAAATSPVALAIGTHPALWQWDLHRQIGDQRTPLNEMGFWGTSAYLARPLQELNALPHRQRTVRDLAVLFAALAPDEVKERYAAAIATFLDRVPHGTSEERDDPDRARALRERYEIFRQQADPANLSIEKKDGRTYLSIIPPYAYSEKHQAMLADNVALNRVLRLYLWATKACDEGNAGSEFTLADAFEEMVALDADDMFDAQASISDMARHHSQSALSATAAVLARHADEELWAGVRDRVIDTTRRAATMLEVEGELSCRGAHVFGHPPAMAARAYAALLAREPSSIEWRAALIQLAIDPIERVAEAPYLAAPLFADVAPDMIWRLFALATQRAARSRDTGQGLFWTSREAQQQTSLADEAERLIAEGKLPDAHPAPGAAGCHTMDGYYRADFHTNALRLPIHPMLDPSTRPALIEHAASAIDWALASLAEKHGRGDTPFEWNYEFARWLGELLGHMTMAEAKSLLIDRLDAAEGEAAGELMDLVTRHFMISNMLAPEPLSADLIRIWEMFIDWAAARPSWQHRPVESREHDHGMAISSFFCAAQGGMICGIEKNWPNLDATMSAITRAVDTFAADQSGFAALLALLRARSDALLPKPGLAWIQRTARERKSERKFWEYASNGEKLILLLRDLVKAGVPAPSDQEIIVEVADTLIEVGVKGAAFLAQDLVRARRN